MYKKSLMLILGSLAFPAWMAAQTGTPETRLGGYFYGQMAAPTGMEWQSPDSVAYNKQQPHAWFFSFEDVESARKLLPEHSSLWQSLDGKWQFHWAKNPAERPADFFRTDFDASGWDLVDVPMNWNVAGIGKDGSQKYGAPLYSNQRVIFQHGVKVGDWKGGVMRTPAKDWLSYDHRNEVGSYRRSFSIPAGWKDKEVYINFDGVDSFFYLYVNGKYVGFSKNSRNLAQFNITPYLNPKGENILAVEVYRHSDGSFLESQDMFRLPGIFRTVALTAKPKVQVRDIVAIPDYDASYTDASLSIKASVANLSGKKQKGYTIDYALYENKLYSDENTLVEGITASAAVEELVKDGEQTASVVLKAGKAIKPWNAEKPYRYTLVGQLKDKKGKVVETFSTSVGFRKIEIKDTPASQDEFGLAGRYYYLNGQPIKMKGVNRHENNPETGHYVTRQQMEKEVFLMKRGNINHVRNCHYPDAPYWYYLCDKYGIYLEDEANIESHQYYYGEASLSHVPEFKNAHIARNMEMVHATVNHPSVCIWSLGNEAGPGKNFVDCYNAIKAFDTSRPIQYERNNDIVDMGSNQYPSIPWVQGAVKGTYKMKYPFHISEYAHSMGNAIGNLIDYWEAIESTNFFIGGAIWDWVDQAIYNYDPATGERYWGYGGDFGQNNKPNDGMFCMNGVMRPDLSPKAQYYEVKKVYQNIGVKAVDMTQGRIEIFNKNYFAPLTDYQIVWSLWKDGVCVEKDKPLQGARNIVGPRQKQQYTLPYDYASLDPESEYFVKVQFLLGENMPWAEKGYVQMEEQLRVRGEEKAAPAIIQVAASDKKINAEEKNGRITLTGDGFKADFDLSTGAIASLTYGNQTIVREGQGPKLDAFRAPTDNDDGIGYPRDWWRNGLYDLKHHALDHKFTPGKNGSWQLYFTVESQGEYGSDHGYSNRDRVPETVYGFEKNRKAIGNNGFKFTTNQIYTIYPDGSIELQSAISASKSSVVLPRIGYAMQLPAELNAFHYYGRGPVNNYNDRKTGQFIELHSGNVATQDIMLPKPQAMGNREEVRWCALTNRSGHGVVFIADSVMSASALPWSQQELTVAAHPYQLPQSTGTHLHLDAKVTGLGGASCGQGGPLRPDRTMSTNYNFGFIIRPVNIGRAMPAIINEAAHVSPSGEQPISFSHSRTGVVTLSTPAKNRTIMYSLNGSKKAQPYTAPIDLRMGGTIVAWYKDNAELKLKKTYDKIESVPLEVVFASSEEPGEGYATHLTDGDTGTKWHTMYSITLAKYPHWIDFDAAETKTMKGFVYTPRQDGPNGRVKDYEIYVSQDGKTWGTPIVKGSFKNSEADQRVMFKKPVKARYIRFNALSEQNGNDFASGAEFSLIAE